MANALGYLATNGTTKNTYQKKHVTLYEDWFRLWNGASGVIDQNCRLHTALTAQQQAQPPSVYLAKIISFVLLSDVGAGGGGWVMALFQLSGIFLMFTATAGFLLGVSSLHDFVFEGRLGGRWGIFYCCNLNLDIRHNPNASNRLQVQTIIFWCSIIMV